MKYVLIVCCSLLLSPHVLHAQQAVLLGPDLESKGVTLRSLSPEGVEVIDWQGNTRTVATDEVLRLTFAPEPVAWPSNDYVLAKLRDGQALAGRLIPSDDEETIGLQLENQRTVSISLDDLVSLSMRRETVAPVVEEDDVLLLATGETLTGFVETITGQSVGFIVGDADDPIEIPLDRIRALAIANKPKPVENQAGLLRVVLTDGSLVLLRGAKRIDQTDTGMPSLVGKPLLEVEPAGFEIPMRRVMRIEPLSGRLALSSLLAAPTEQVAGGEVFGVAMPPRIDSKGGLFMHAPTTLAFELPRGASRVALTAELDLRDDIPRARRAIAGCELVVYDGEKVIGELTLTYDQPPQRLNVPLSSRTLRLELKPGVNGPVLDRVRLTHAEVLIRER